MFEPACYMIEQVWDEEALAAEKFVTQYVVQFWSPTTRLKTTIDRHFSKMRCHETLAEHGCSDPEKVQMVDLREGLD